MKKRPTMITLLVTAAVSLILGLLADYHFAVHTDFRSELVPELFFGMFPAMFVFLALWLFNKVRRLLEFPKKSVKPFVCLAFAVYAAEMIAFGFMGGDESARFQYHLKDLYFILFALCFSCLFLAILLIDVDESVRVVLFDDYTLRCRQTLIPNKENLPVTIGKLCTAETYFENDDYEQIYLDHFDFLRDTAEKEAKKAIFENDLQCDTCGEWFLSRVDFLEGDAFSPTELHFYMTFISKKIKSYRLYGIVELSRKVIESDFCRVDCIFGYKSSDTEKPFTFKETCVELV